LRDGIRQEKIHYEAISQGVFCMPVISDFYATHQWLREIKMCQSSSNIIAVYFKIPDNETVFFGHYNDEIIKTTASEAHRILNEAEDKMGFQLIVPRKILKSEVTKTKNMPQIIGWRYYPKSHERKRCLCPACLQAGTYGSTRIKEAEISRLFKNLRNASASPDIISALNEINYPIFNVNKFKLQSRDEELLVKLSKSKESDIKYAAIRCLSVFFGGKYAECYLDAFYDANDILDADSCLSALFQVRGNNVFVLIDLERCNEEKKKLIDEYRD